MTAGEVDVVAVSVSGWCGHNPPGTEPKHDQCRFELCQCPCGHPNRQPIPAPPERTN